MKQLVTCLAFSVTLLAQQPAPQEQPGGWRKFNPQEQNAQNQVSGPYLGEAADRAPGPQGGPAVQTGPLPGQLTLPAGSWVRVRVDQLLSSDHNRMGDSFTATLTQPLIAQGFVVARRGQTIGGRIADAQKAGFVKGTSKLSLELGEVTLVDGQHKQFKTELIQYSGGTSIGRDVTGVGVTTGLGAAIGAAADNGFGAAVGAGAGAAAGLIGVLSTRGRATVVYPEDTLTFRTVDPITISTDGAQQAFLPATQSDYDAPNRLQTRGPAYPRPRPYYGAGPFWPYGPYGYGYGPGFYGPSVVIYGRGGYRHR